MSLCLCVFVCLRVYLLLVLCFVFGLFICLLVRSAVCVFVWLLVFLLFVGCCVACVFVCSFVWSFARLLVCSFVCSFVRSPVCLFVRLCVCLLVYTISYVVCHFVSCLFVVLHAKCDAPSYVGLHEASEPQAGRNSRQTKLAILAWRFGVR